MTTYKFEIGQLVEVTPAMTRTTVQGIIVKRWSNYRGNGNFGYGYQVETPDGQTYYAMEMRLAKCEPAATQYEDDTDDSAFDDTLAPTGDVIETQAQMNAITDTVTISRDEYEALLVERDNLAKEIERLQARLDRYVMPIPKWWT
jgi:hypothetical protein